VVFATGGWGVVNILFVVGFAILGEYLSSGKRGGRVKYICMG
jgi:hypothetical protein